MMQPAPVPGAMPPDVPAPANEAAVDPREVIPGIGDQATPEEQAMYEKIVANAMNLVYDEKTMPAVTKMLEGGGDPIEGLARTSAMVISRVMQSAEKAGVQVDAVVAFHAGTEIFEDLAELSKEADIKDFSTDADALEGAYFRALDYVRLELQQNGKIDPELAKADMQKLEGMDASGQLEQLMMGLADQDGRGRPGKEEEEEAEDEPMKKPARRGLMTEAA